MDVAEFSAPDCEVAAQSDLPYTLIGGVPSTHPIKRHTFRVSQLIKPPNTLIVSPIKDRKKYPYIDAERLHQTTASKLTSWQNYEAATVRLLHRQLAQGCVDYGDRARSWNLY
jgi:hypothetical protein